MAKKSKKSKKGKPQRAKARKAVKPLASPVELTASASAASSVEAPQTIASASSVEAPQTIADQRGSRRISLEVELHLASESHFFSGLSGDISEGGVFVSTYRPLAMGSLVDIAFSLPGSDRPLRARGEVRWQRDGTPYGAPGVGIAFDELSDDDRAVIQRFCTMRPPLYYDDVG